MPAFPDRLSRGYAAFRDETLPTASRRYSHLAETGQRPEIMVVGCCDSRVAPELIFNAAPGEMFVHRNVANLIPTYRPDGELHGASAALEFGVTVLKVKHLVLMGHGRCGGIHAYLAEAAGGAPTLGAGDFIGRWIKLIEPAARLIADDPSEGSARQRALEFASIRQGLTNLRTFPWVRDGEVAGTLALHGAWFDISTAELLVLNEEIGAFAPVTAV